MFEGSLLGEGDYQIEHLVKLENKSRSVFLTLGSCFCSYYLLKSLLLYSRFMLLQLLFAEEFIALHNSFRFLLILTYQNILWYHCVFLHVQRECEVEKENRMLSVLD